MPNSFCILAAGKGTRLGNLTAKINKALLPIGNKAAISYIIEKVPLDTEIVIAVGYLKTSLMEYCLAAHPNKKFRFVEVEKWTGPGSGPGQSLLECKPYLQNPFYLCTVDCLFTDELPSLGHNWLAVYPTNTPQHYSTVSIDTQGNLLKLINKSQDGFNLAYTGLAGIKDYKVFWNELENASVEIERENVSAFYHPEHYTDFKIHLLTNWYDVGSNKGYEYTKSSLSSVPMGFSKTSNELTYHVNNTYVKFMGDPNRIVGKIKRADQLGSLVPTLKFKGTEVYSYDWVPGTTLYNTNNLSILKKFFSWLKDNLWVDVKIENFKAICYEFYHDKTYSRLNLFLAHRAPSYRESHIIKGNLCGPIEDYLERIDWSYLANGKAVRFHGDLHFENSLYTNQNYLLIDWRESFASTIEGGDLYYDLAKLYGGCIMSYAYMTHPENYQINISNNITYSWKVPDYLCEIKAYYEQWIIDNGYDLNKVKLITALIFLNMAPLHQDQFDEILFFEAKYMLQNLLPLF